MNKKRIAVLMAVMLLIGVASGATLAWLKASASPVHNVFTVGDINITLEEEAGETKTGDTKRYFHFVPGDELDKDPKVTVDATSEDCYLFVKVDVANNSCTDTTVTPNVTADPIFSWTFDSKWGNTVYVCEEKTVNGKTYHKLSAYTGDFTDDGTYYLWYDWKNVTDAITEFGILADNKIMLSPDVTKGMVSTINNADTQPSVTFEAAAVQSKNLAEADGDVTAMMKIMEQLPSEFKVVNP